MTRTTDGMRQIAELRPTGLVRFIPAAFLCFWLCGWAAGEVFALGLVAKGVQALLAAWASHPHEFLARIQNPGAALVGGFLLVWLAGWTFAGISALMALLEIVGGGDRISWDADGIELIRRRGPFARRRAIPRDQIERITMYGRGDVLVAHTRRGRVRLTALGSPAERRELRDALRATLAPAPRADIVSNAPPGYEIEIDDQGLPCLVRTRAAVRGQVRIAAGIAIAIAAALAVVVTLFVPRSGWTSGAIAGAGFLGVLLVLAFGMTLSMAFGRESIAVRSGRIEIRTVTFGRRRSLVLENPTLALEWDRDSDSDGTVSLVAVADGRRHTIPTWSSDVAHLIALARWMASRLGTPLEIPPQLDRSEAA